MVQQNPRRLLDRAQGLDQGAIPVAFARQLIQILHGQYERPGAIEFLKADFPEIGRQQPVAVIIAMNQVRVAQDSNDVADLQVAADSRSINSPTESD
jgi:hypothetical protein